MNSLRADRPLTYLGIIDPTMRCIACDKWGAAYGVQDTAYRVKHQRFRRQPSDPNVAVLCAEHWGECAGYWRAMWNEYYQQTR